MRTICSFLILIILLSCGNRKEHPQTIDNPDVVRGTDTIGEKQHHEEAGSSLPPKAYSNERFREVTVRRAGNRFTLSGKGQLFEAHFGWVVEDGHNELMNGFEMTDAGAPAWGNFEFSVEVQKQRPFLCRLFF